MNVTLIDRIGALVLQNGIMRVDCFAAGPNGQETPSGTLLIPAGQAEVILKTLVGAVQELDRRLREQGQQAGPVTEEPERMATASSAPSKTARAEGSSARQPKSL
jgi:hypothetical protein